jgi:hypothetical protein
MKLEVVATGASFEGIEATQVVAVVAVVLVGDGAAFELAYDAKHVDLAFLFDPMMAVYTSNVEPLPHQFTAVNESMLPHQPLRFVLADDPGAGKAIMAGLCMRGSARADGRGRSLVMCRRGVERSTK